MDKKQERMYKYLQTLASTIPGYLKRRHLVNYNPYKDVYCRFGRMYATNGFMIACVEYPDMVKDRFGEYCWETIEIRDGEFHGTESETPDKDDIFERFFPYPTEVDFDMEAPFKSKLMIDALKPFAIYDLNVTIHQAGHYLMFSGHDKDVSIKTVLMGVRK